MCYFLSIHDNDNSPVGECIMLCYGNLAYLDSRGWIVDKMEFNCKQNVWLDKHACLTLFRKGPLKQERMSKNAKLTP